MGDSAALVSACFAQGLVAALLAWLLGRFRPQFGLAAKIALAASFLPLLVIGLGLWMTFGMGRITDLGAMAIAACLIVALLLLPVGLVAAALCLKALRKAASS